MLRGIIVLCLINSLCAVRDETVWANASQHECGVMSASVGLIQGGSRSDREAFPWLVNIFAKYLSASLFAGSGSLISDRHVLCGANSVAYENYLGDSLDLDPEQVSGRAVELIFDSKTSTLNRATLPTEVTTSACCLAPASTRT